MPAFFSLVDGSNSDSQEEASAFVGHLTEEVGGHPANSPIKYTNILEEILPKETLGPGRWENIAEQIRSRKHPLH